MDELMLLRLVDKEGRSALDLAKEQQFTQMVEYLERAENQ